MSLRSRSYWATRTSAWALAAGMVVLSASCVGADDGKRAYHIEARTTAAALSEFARQAGVAIMFDYEEAARTAPPPLNGTYTRAEALVRLLANTRFVVAKEVDGAVYLKVSERQSGSNESAGSADIDNNPVEIVVTGTYIRGAQPAAPARRVNRQSIDNSGYSQTGDLVRGLPENFNGGQNPGVQPTTSNLNQNLSNASTVNLRGLGSDATLVLLNGRRLASDASVQSADISAIPLAAVQRVDIITDGASALYGSDAVAGVVNFILRQDIDGGEAFARWGGATEGGGFEETYGVTTGKVWSGGNVLASVEYQHQDAIGADQRDYTRNVVPSNALVNAQTRKSVYLGGTYSVSDGLSFTADLLHADRQSGNIYEPFLGYRYPLAQLATSTTVNLGGRMDLPGDWSLRIDASTARSTNELRTGLTPTFVAVSEYDNRVRALDLVATGTLLTTSAGPIKLAVGSGYRFESYADLTDGAADREVKAVFAELSAPLVSPSATRFGLRSLYLSLAWRRELYSDVGEATAPKVGLRYVPFNDLVVRGTWGKSFKAPTFFQMVVNHNTFLYDATTVGGTSGTVLFDYGGSPNLKPEKATAWSAGFDWTPSQWPGFKLSLSYIDTDYRDRIIFPITVVAQALTDPLYTPYITLNPTPGQQAALIASSEQFRNNASVPYDPARTIAILHDRYTNAAAQTAQVYDLAVSHRQVIGGAFKPVSIEVFLNASWLELKQQTLAGAPEMTLSGTLFNPPEVRARAGATFTRGGWTTTAIVNHMGSSTDTGVVPTAGIDAWTTLDLTATWRPATGWFAGNDIALSVLNALNAEPPVARGADWGMPGIYFDSTNASPVGRFVSLRLRRSF